MPYLEVDGEAPLAHERNEAGVHPQAFDARLGGTEGLKGRHKVHGGCVVLQEGGGGRSGTWL